jgi:predicted DNA-binding transcriptional regulator AlpA
MSNGVQLSANNLRKHSDPPLPRAIARSTKLQTSQEMSPTSPQVQSVATQDLSGITFLRLPQVKATTGLSKTTIYEKIKDNAFPCPVQISKRAVAWVESEVRQWAASQVSARTMGVRIPPQRAAFVGSRQPVVKTA